MECGNLIDILNTEKTALASFSAPEILKIAQRMRLTNSVYTILREHYGIPAAQLANFKPVFYPSKSMSFFNNTIFQLFILKDCHSRKNCLETL